MKLAILGYGVEGKSIERYFRSHPCDNVPPEDIEIKVFDNFKPKDLDKLGLDDFDVVFRSPSVPPRDGWTSATKYFFEHCPAEIIGVTGTKGKGTTCSMIAAIIDEMSRRLYGDNNAGADSAPKTYLVGNIGNPCLDILDQIKPHDNVVFELSSFQLWDLTANSYVGVLLRIEPDHLNVHKDFEDYVRAKSAISRYKTATDHLVYFSENDTTKSLATESKAIKHAYPLLRAKTKDTEKLSSKSRARLREILDNISLPGEHNKENAEAALLAVAARFTGGSLEDFLTSDELFEAAKTALKNFKGLPHRLEFVRELNNVRYYDDNFSSAFPATDVAIAAFKNQPTVLIAGGKDRGLDLTDFRNRLATAKNLEKIILLGEIAEQLAGDDPIKYELVSDVDTAVVVARIDAEDIAKKTGRTVTVVMSPGAASFDMFKDFKDRGEQYQKSVRRLKIIEPSFRFLNYDFDKENFVATFRYENLGTEFTERVKFAKTNQIINDGLLDHALFLSFVLIGTSYFKAAPTGELLKIENRPLDDFQAHFFSAVYQEGLSQFAFENNLTRADLGHFAADTANSNDGGDASATNPADPINLNPADYSGELILQSGGKDSLLTASISDPASTFWYLGSSENYPKVLDEVAKSGTLQITERKIDLENLSKVAKLNGHVPVTYIVMSLALIQAILNHNRAVITSIGHEGAEPHAHIGNLAVNHQWSKTYEAEKMFANYVHRYISPDFKIGSKIRKYSELKIAELFAKNCWEDYGRKFSSCNVANYRQKTNNGELKWCGNCAKCANSYLLFAPFIPRAELDEVIGRQIGGKSLFENENLLDDFKGLLGIDDYLKPFECVGEIAELRAAYHQRKPEYPSLPFEVPSPSEDYSYEKLYESQEL